MDLAREAELSAQQVRNYEAYGFLPAAERGPNGYRLYTDRHLEALRTARPMIKGYGWQGALAIMREAHRNDIDAALALVDARHGYLDQTRRRVDETLVALRALSALPERWTTTERSRDVRIGETARRVGVRVSTVRYWEQRGLLDPEREHGNRYRLYDERQRHHLQVIALLRELDYGFDAIASVLDDMASGNPEKALEAVERRREELAKASRACAEATVAFWLYVSGQPDHPQATGSAGEVE